MKVSAGEETGPETGVDCRRCRFPSLNEVGSEPETLNEHRHQHELSDSASKTPNEVKFDVSDEGLFADRLESSDLLLLRVESFDGRDCRHDSIDSSRALRDSFSILIRQRSSVFLGDSDEDGDDRDSGENDEGEAVVSIEREDE